MHNPKTYTKFVCSSFGHWHPSIMCAGGSKMALFGPQVAGAWSERQKMFHGGSFLKLADDNMDIQNPEAQNREMSGF